MEGIINHDVTKVVAGANDQLVNSAIIEQIQTLLLVQKELSQRGVEEPADINLSFDIGVSNINISTRYQP
jgi:hypothetical protein